jgi:hypothetical protein
MAVTWVPSQQVMCPGVSARGGQGPGGTTEVLTLTIFCREGRPPAGDIFACPAARSQYLLNLLARRSSRSPAQPEADGTVTFGLAADAIPRGSAGRQDGVSDNDPRTLAEYVTHCPKIFVR